jgi:hypothetical protein
MQSIPILPKARLLVSVSNGNQYLISGLQFLLLNTANSTHAVGIPRHNAGLFKQSPCEIVSARGNSLKQTSGILGKLNRIAVF